MNEFNVNIILDI